MKRSVNYILLLFFAGSIAGWCWEALVYWLTHSGCTALSILLNYRGVLHGPWVPIYGFGCVLLLLLKMRLGSHPLRFLFTSMTACGVMEYGVSFGLEKLFHARWWDYSDAFLNLNGRICAGSLLFFGLAGMAIIYLAEPRLYTASMWLPAQARKSLTAVLLLLFIFDAATGLVSPNMGIGVRGISA